MLKCKNNVIKLLTVLLALSLILVSVALFLGHDSSVKGSDNALIANGSFEDGYNNWTIGNELSCKFGSSDPFYDGANSLKLKCSKDKEFSGKILSAVTTINTDVKYVITVHIYVEGSYSTNLTVKLVKDAKGSEVSSDSYDLAVSEVKTLSELKTNEWETLTYNLTVPSTKVDNAEQADVRLAFDFKATTTTTAKTTVYLDNITMVEKENVAIQDGAVLKIDGEDSGLKFTGVVDKEYFDELVKTYGEENVSAGIITAPIDLIEKAERFTVEELEKANIPYLEMESHVWKDEVITSETGYKMECVIVELKPQNIDRVYGARAYVKYNDGDKDIYVYSTYSESVNTASAKSLAEKQIQDVDPSDDSYGVLDYFANSVTEASITTYDNVSVNGKIIRINFTTTDAELTVTANGSPISAVSVINIGNEYSYCYYLVEGISEISLSFSSAVSDVTLKTYCELETWLSK